MDMLLSVLGPHASMFDGRLGHISTVTHHNPTHGPPIDSQPYRAVPKSREAIDVDTKSMLENEVKVPATRPWPSPIVLMPKPDGTVRFCIDYRKLNEVTQRTIPMPFV